MSEPTSTIRVAVVQAAPVLLDREATVEKACGLIAEVATHDAGLILFPEAYIPAYPRGLSFGTVVGSRSAEGRRTWQRHWDNAVDVPGPATEALGCAAREAGAYLAIGVIERGAGAARGTLYCSLLYFGPDGRLLGVHRKLKPTGAERLIWGEGDGSGLIVLDTTLGKVGGLICWESYMPLARMALYQQGVEIYLAPTADARETWQATLRHIACEGRCFVLGCNQYVTKAMYPADLPGIDDLADQPEVLCRGGSAIVSPLGELLAGPLYDREGILYAELDIGEIVRARFDFDVVGHYARPDVFHLDINDTPTPDFVSTGRTDYTKHMTLVEPPPSNSPRRGEDKNRPLPRQSPSRQGEDKNGRSHVSSPSRQGEDKSRPLPREQPFPPGGGQERSLSREQPFPLGGGQERSLSREQPFPPGGGQGRPSPYG